MQNYESDIHTLSVTQHPARISVFHIHCIPVATHEHLTSLTEDINVNFFDNLSNLEKFDLAKTYTFFYTGLEEH
jgi:hypothetical protein